MKAEGREDMTEEELKSLAEDSEKDIPNDEPSDEESQDDVEPDESRDAEEPQDNDAEPSEKDEARSEEEEEPTKEEDDTDKHDDEPSDEESKDDVQTNDNKEDKESNIRKMKENFSLIKAIRSLAEGKAFDESTKAVIEAGRNEMRSAGLSYAGQITMPTEQRAVTVAAEGEDLVETEIKDLLLPLRAKNVLTQAGAKMYGNLRGNLQIPIMGANTCGFAGEIEAAVNGQGEYKHVTLSPRRISAYVDISKAMLLQDSVDVENAIITDLGNAISNKIEEQFFSDSTGDTKAYAGIFSKVAPTAVSSFKELVDKEAEIEDANVQGDVKYVLSNKAKAALRNMSKSAKSTELVYEKGEVDGTEALNTSHVTGKNYVYGDFSNVAIGVWDGVDITVDTISQAINGVVRIVANAYVDVEVLRPEAFTAGTLA